MSKKFVWEGTFALVVLVALPASAQWRGQAAPRPAPPAVASVQSTGRAVSRPGGNMTVIVDDHGPSLGRAVLASAGFGATLGVGQGVGLAIARYGYNPYWGPRPVMIPIPAPTWCETPDGAVIDCQLVRPGPLQQLAVVWPQMVQTTVQPQPPPQDIPEVYQPPAPVPVQKVVGDWKIANNTNYLVDVYDGDPEPANYRFRIASQGNQPVNQPAVRWNAMMLVPQTDGSIKPEPAVTVPSADGWVLLKQR